MSEFNKELCEERHENIEKTHSRLFTALDKHSIKLNWFYGVAILTLVGVIANLLK